VAIMRKEKEFGSANVVGYIATLVVRENTENAPIATMTQDIGGLVMKSSATSVMTTSEEIKQGWR